MEWQGGNKQKPSCWQWRRSFILVDSNWKCVQIGYPVDTPTDCKSNRAKSNATEGRLPRLVAVLSLTSLPELWPLALVSSRGISRSKWRWFWNVQLVVFSNRFAKINALQPNRSPEKVLNKWVIDCRMLVRTYMLFWNDLEPFNDFKFGASIGRFPSDGVANTAVKGLIIM